ncbi:MAG: hypothetical protein UZ03_NOB001001880 [Nitrospira sp. OLB3]|nr:MAG: hypothetical protein UZ03_NOB001001880 [Nitrospira sp. OLB3]
MQAILSLIYCWLKEFWLYLTDWQLGVWDSLLGVADGLLGSLSVGALAIQVIPEEYAWVLGATGVSQCLAIFGTAMLTRFILQSIPFVRWGS